jgi:radical SAM superfamily enzyme YgiQ (UPF0313 family)
MNVKMILPALTEATSPFFRPIKYSLFPPLGLATLAAYLDGDDAVRIVDEHVETLDLDDDPDLVVIQVYIPSAYRAYRIADHYRSRGSYVVLGGIHVTSQPAEAASHADTICLGPGEDIWVEFLRDYRAGVPKPLYRSVERTLKGAPPARRDLIKRHLYLVPNSIVVSRGCPHACDFCYKEAFYQGGSSFYTQAVDAALAEIERLPGRHVYFLDDHLLANQKFAGALFDGMRGMGRLWQAAGTVRSVLMPGILEKAAACGLRSLFVGFETVNPASLKEQHKAQNMNCDYDRAVRRLHDLGIMVNGSFVFGMDGDNPGVFGRTVDWALSRGIETATFHILTPYPGTRLHARMVRQGRILHQNWDLYDTRHCVFRPAGMSIQQLEAGYWTAYRDFYRWGSILHSAATKETWPGSFRHLAYAAGWKKCEPLWNLVIRARRVAHMLPLLEHILAGGRKTDAGFKSAAREYQGIQEILHPASSILHPVSCILDPVSTILSEGSMMILKHSQSSKEIRHGSYQSCTTQIAERLCEGIGGRICGSGDRKRTARSREAFGRGIDSRAKAGRTGSAKRGIEVPEVLHDGADPGRIRNWIRRHEEHVHGLL